MLHSLQVYVSDVHASIVFIVSDFKLVKFLRKKLFLAKHRSVLFLTDLVLLALYKFFDGNLRLDYWGFFRDSEVLLRAYYLWNFA